MTSTPADLDVSIVLPIHNEAGHLQTEIDRIANAMEASSGNSFSSTTGHQTARPRLR